MLYQLSYASPNSLPLHPFYRPCKPNRNTRSSARAECAAVVTLAHQQPPINAAKLLATSYLHVRIGSALATQRFAPGRSLFMLLRLRPIVFCLLALSTTCLLAQKSLNDDSIIKMAKAGLSDGVIIQAVDSQPGTFSTSADDLIRLKQAGVSNQVLAALLAKDTGTAATAPQASGLPPGVDEIGVYYKNKDGAWIEMAPEIINFKSGGFLKSLATDGIVKQDWNGHLNGRTAKLALAKPVEFLIYAPEGAVPEEYQLLKFRVNSKDREFRSTTGGVFHSSTGANRDKIPFTANRIAPHLYEFALPSDAMVGEYGILPPGAVSSINAASGGTIYTFKIQE